MSERMMSQVRIDRERPGCQPPTAVSSGRSAPLGACVAEGGVNFSLYSRHATSQTLPDPPVPWDIESEPMLAGPKLLTQANESWHGVKLNQPDWNDHSHGLALHAELPYQGLYFHWMLNAYWESREFELPRLPSGPWRRWIDTALNSPNDIVPWDTAPQVTGDYYPVETRSVVMLIAGGQAV